MKTKKAPRPSLAHAGSPATATSRQAAVASCDKKHGAETVSTEEIRQCAFQKWENAGRPNGDGIQFWLEAEHELIHGN
jgi:hypothetical protein